MTIKILPTATQNAICWHKVLAETEYTTINESVVHKEISFCNPGDASIGCDNLITKR